MDINNTFIKTQSYHCYYLICFIISLLHLAVSINIKILFSITHSSFSALMQLVGRQKGHLAIVVDTSQGGHKVGEKIPRVFQAFPEP